MSEPCGRIGLAMDDALSALFRLIRLKSCVYFQRDFWSPWAMDIKDTGFAQFHIVTRGRCVAQLEDETLELGVGDVLLLPRGAAHVLADQEGRAAVPGPQAMASFAGAAPCFSSGERATRLICGHYAYRVEPGHPVIEELPDAILVSALDAAADEALHAVLRLLMSELAGEGPGANSVVERLSEVLLVQILRAHFAVQPQERGFYAGLADRRLARALGRIHRDAAANLSLEALAQEAGMSRSAFALHFKATTGTAPIEYLARWRMVSAADLLRSADLSLGEIAERVGYDSEIAFGRAFKRAFKVSPSQYRRRI